MKIKTGVHVVFVALCTVVSMVGYCFNGSVPALELMLALPRHPRPTPAGPPPLNEQPTVLSGTLPCSCPTNQPLRNINNVSNGTLVADEPRSHFISSHVVKVLPLKKLQQMVSFSRHRGLSHLDHTALNRYYLCRTQRGTTRFNANGAGDDTCKSRAFLDRKLPIVALVSFPGSGNTWMRYLLEQATGVFTGSIYCDQVLKTVFPGEYVVSGSVVAVKTHLMDSRELPEDVQLVTGKKNFDKAVVVVRNPFDALVSEANRQWSSRKEVDSHVGVAPERAFIGEELCVTNIANYI